MYSATPHQSQNNAALPIVHVAIVRLVQTMCPASDCSSAFHPANQERRVFPLLTPKRTIPFGHSGYLGRKARGLHPIHMQCPSRSHAQVQHLEHNVVQCCRPA